MSGHSKWANIKHKKAKEDALKGKVFTKIGKEIAVAVKEGGGDPAGNARLRMVIEKAKSANMPADNINRAIKKASGELGGVSYEAIVYEGYGPAGTAVIVDALTDNKKRTVADVRHIFTKYGGNLGETNSVGWMFEHKGVIRATGAISEDELIEKLLDYGVDNIEHHEMVFTIHCAIPDLEKVKEAVGLVNMKIESANLEYVPKTHVEITDSEQEEKVVKFLEALDDLDDVQSVYSNLG